MHKTIRYIIFSLITLGIVIFSFVYVKVSVDPIPAQTYDIKEEFIIAPSVCNTNQEIEYMYYRETDVWWEENNKFGMYIYAENRDFFELAQTLVNSNDGKWGYVLIPFNMADRDYGKWNRVFEQLRNKELIPVIQLWQLDMADYKNQTTDAAKFLNNFLWPIKYKYISVYNETNDAKFWNNNVNPGEYAQVLDYTISAFKEVNPDFYIMNGAFNVSAPNDTTNMDSFLYMTKMNEEVPGIFEKLDAWASHPYPQPNFSGNPLDKGRWSIKAYEDELDYLRDSLTVKKELPVFITETGWAHAEGENYDSSYYTVDRVGDFFQQAYEDVWLKDTRVRAVMPFTIRYDPPFDHFSWVNKDNVPYRHYDIVKKMNKTKGEPPIIESAKVKINLCSF